eukprot:jgi/Picsp_1/3144/NSC_05984-R1_splicing factor u2af large subunit
MELIGKDTTNAQGASVQGLDAFQHFSSEICMTLTPENLERNIESINSGTIEKFKHAANHWRAQMDQYYTWSNQIRLKYGHLVSQQTERSAKRLYVGNLPADITEVEIAEGLFKLLESCGGVYRSGNPVVSCRIYPDKLYSFVELRSIDETSNCMALDGARFRGNFLKIRRPSNYDPHSAILLGPTDPSISLDLSRLDLIRTVVEDSPHKIFIGGLPCEWSEDQVKELLKPFGPLKAFILIMDRSTGNSKGYAFCEYLEPSITDVVIRIMNGTMVGKKSLTVRRALSPLDQLMPHMAIA